MTSTSDYKYQTPKKVSELPLGKRLNNLGTVCACASDAKTIATVALEEASPTNTNTSTYTPSPSSPSFSLTTPTPTKTSASISIGTCTASPSASSSRSTSPYTSSFKRRANLMTLMIDMSPDPSPSSVSYKKSFHSNSDGNGEGRTPLSERNKNIPTAPKKKSFLKKNANANGNEEGLDKALQIMVNSTDRILSDARQDLNKELNRSYNFPSSITSGKTSTGTGAGAGTTGTGTETYNDDDDNDEERQMRKEEQNLEGLEQSCQHEVNFAMDKIAYRHRSTQEFATKCDLIPVQSKSIEPEVKTSKLCNVYSDEDLMDRFLEFFCCNHGIDMKDSPSINSASK